MSGGPSRPRPGVPARGVGRAVRCALASLRVLSFFLWSPEVQARPACVPAHVGTCVFQGPCGTGGPSGLARSRPLPPVPRYCGLGQVFSLICP